LFSSSNYWIIGWDDARRGYSGFGGHCFRLRGSTRLDRQSSAKQYDRAHKGASACLHGHAGRQSRRGCDRGVVPTDRATAELRSTNASVVGGPNYASGSASTTAPDLPTWLDICQAEAWQRSIFAATQSWAS
jgi:hypothetical protein